LVFWEKAAAFSFSTPYPVDSVNISSRWAHSPLVGCCEGVKIA
jgi:hypothetical protein